MKTDLCGEILDGFSSDNAPKQKYHRRGAVDIAKIVIETEEESRLIEKPMGTYITMEAMSISLGVGIEEEAAALSDELSDMLTQKGNILALGLGNSLLTADSLGPHTVERLSVGHFGGRRLFALSTGVCSKTGFEPFAMIKSAVERIKPSAVIAVDSLCCEDINRIAKTVQISDSGISPGSGVGNFSFELTEKSIGVPVIAMGIPTVCTYPNTEVLCTRSDIDLSVKKACALLSIAIEHAVFPLLDIDFLHEMLI